MNSMPQNVVGEWSFSSRKRYKDPFDDIELNVLFTGQTGDKKLVPAFWAGENMWYVRFSSPLVGKYQYRTICSDSSNCDLHNQNGEFEVIPYQGMNQLFEHGPLKVAPDRRHLQHFDGRPFFWLGDTQWMSLCKRLSWPRDFQSLAMDRIEKGFTVIQLVAGPYPDMPPFDERGGNEAGFPWEHGYTRINPAYFDLADRRISYLVDMGLVPCIFGCWGYYMDFMGLEKMKKHWRYLVARYGALPVIWCLAGEAIMPYYVSEVWNHPTEYIPEAKAKWTEVTRYLRHINSFDNLITIHPAIHPLSEYGREQIEDPSLIDFDMLQTGHDSHHSFPNTIRCLRHSLGNEPKMPVLVGEPCYEGMREAGREEIQRLLFWACILSGAAGHTYGANGLWQINTKEKPFGPSPHGVSWGDTSWEEAAQLPGSRQLGIAKKLLERYPWWQFEPHPEWVKVNQRSGFYTKENDDYFVPYAAGIPQKVRIIYFNPLLSGLFVLADFCTVKYLEPEVTYHAFFFNPSDGAKHDLGKVIPDNKKNWRPSRPPVFRDWVLVLEARS